jgi:hypothetical protein
MEQRVSDVRELIVNSFPQCIIYEFLFPQKGRLKQKKLEIAIKSAYRFNDHVILEVNRSRTKFTKCGGKI